VHGFATWALATLITSFVIAYAAVGTLSGAAKAVSSAASGIAQAGVAAASSGGQSSANDYEIDSLFRSTGDPVRPEVRTEAMRILAKGIGAGDVSGADRQYLVELVAARTGISSGEAEQRVNSAIADLKAAELKARQVADDARKAASAAALCTALSMLIGAFIASVAAALGGRERDSHP
jgi:hypothetical protein